MDNLALLRKIGIWEGISALILFFFAMPMKYMFDAPLWVTVIGNIHGFLFVIYMVFVVLVGNKYKWSIAIYVMCFLGAIFPFGPFIIDAKFLKPLSNK